MDDKQVAQTLAALKAEIKTKGRHSLTTTKPARLPKTHRSIRKTIASIVVAIVVACVVFPPLYWPVRGAVSSEFLFRFKPDSRMPALEIHHGIDIAASSGTAIFPSALGIVQTSAYSSELGNYVIIRHPFGFSTLYAHLQKPGIHKGAIALPALSHIGSVGASGRATGPHLHVGVFWLGVALPPRLMFAFHSARRLLLGF